MIIAYDVQVMQELIKASQTANDELHKAQNLIQEVHSHSDWTCKEKNTIDDLMRECKNMVKKLCEEQFSFLEAIKLVGDELGEVENSVSNLFQSVESMLSKILAIPVVESVVNGGGLISGAVGAAQQIVDTGSDIVGNGMGNVTSWINDQIDIFEEWGQNVISTIIDVPNWGELWPISIPIDINSSISAGDSLPSEIVPIIAPSSVINNNFTEAISTVKFDNLCSSLK